LSVGEALLMPALVCARGGESVPEEVICRVYVGSQNGLSGWCRCPRDVEARWGRCGEGSLCLVDGGRHCTKIVGDVGCRLSLNSIVRLVGWNNIETLQIIY
jgi:hypothetical protein